MRGRVSLVGTLSVKRAVLLLVLAAWILVPPIDAACPDHDHGSPGHACSWCAGPSGALPADEIGSALLQTSRSTRPRSVPVSIHPSPPARPDCRDPPVHRFNPIAVT
jgi:hypothetical protein